MTISTGLVYVGSTLVAGGVTVPSPGVLYGSAATTTITTPASTNTWGSWVEIVASNPTATQWLRCQLGSQAFTGNTNNGAGLLQFGTGGAGSETAIGTFAMSNLVPGSLIVDCPMPIASGARIAVRCQVGSRTSITLSLLFDFGTLPYTPSAPVGMGANTSTSDGVTLGVPGASNGTTYGAWTEMTSSSSARFRGLHVAPTLDANTNTSAATFKLDIGTGGAGSEVSIGKVVSFACTSNETIFGPVGRILACDIPSGTRIAARYTRTNTAPLALVLHGIPQ